MEKTSFLLKILENERRPKDILGLHDFQIELHQQTTNLYTREIADIDYVITALSFFIARVVVDSVNFESGNVKGSLFPQTSLNKTNISQISVIDRIRRTNIDSKKVSRLFVEVNSDRKVIYSKNGNFNSRIVLKLSGNYQLRKIAYVNIKCEVTMSSFINNQEQFTNCSNIDELTIKLTGEYRKNKHIEGKVKINTLRILCDNELRAINELSYLNLIDFEFFNLYVDGIDNTMITDLIRNNRKRITALSIGDFDSFLNDTKFPKLKRLYVKSTSVNFNINYYSEITFNAKNFPEIEVLSLELKYKQINLKTSELPNLKILSLDESSRSTIDTELNSLYFSRTPFSCFQPKVLELPKLLTLTYKGCSSKIKFNSLPYWCTKYYP